MKKRLLLKEGINCIGIGKKIANDNAYFVDTSFPNCWLLRGGNYNNNDGNSNN